MELSAYAADLVRVISEPVAAADDPLSQQVVDDTRLSDHDLGALAVAARRRMPGSGYSPLAVRLRMLLGTRQPRFTTVTCDAFLEAVADRAALDVGGHPTLAVNALLHCDGPWPPKAAKTLSSLLRSLIKHGRITAPYAMVALASVSGGLTGVLVRQVFKATLPPIAQEELTVLTKIGPPALLPVAEVAAGDRSYDLPPPSSGQWRRLAENDQYREYSWEALRTAADRVARIHSGELPFAADKAFDHLEVGTLGRALRVLLLLDERDLPELLRPLVFGVSVAPMTPGSLSGEPPGVQSAKTLPSQALLYEIVRAAVDFPTPEVLTILREARSRVRHKGVAKQLDRKLKLIELALADRPEVATRLPDLGFDREGVLEFAAGQQTAVVLATPEDVTMSWRADGGKVSATPSAAVKRDFKQVVTAARELHKRAKAHHRSLIRALENGIGAPAEQTVERWHAELAGTGLGLAVARGLVWELECAPGRWQAVLLDGEAFVDVDGGVVKPADAAGIRLWHPIRSSTPEILAWRDLLMARGLRQPFKQAFREIYLLTPAEESAGSESLRFAAHVVRYKQFYALVKGRGWSTPLLGPWDGGDFAEATRVLPGGQWRAVLEQEYADAEDDCAITGRIRFQRLEDGVFRPAALTGVPPLLFSEAMRDVDLFVGVASIAIDPEWTVDRARHHAYWWQAGFGDLTETARSRRDALARLLPRLTIADRCELRDRWLVVRGTRRTYKIHLGSGNILMDPDDAYLCIVPARGKTEPVFLPFTDDRLSIILSKALLLAADAKITDPSILRQIGPGGG
ncbi:MAG: DUF4132 domain-containing protein [Hamadaea sp.]|uniref:DUF4132 domain-containing protein n=1 Tax=Hamadaea sp. TaxID=2024425 RepID=UPI0018193A3F|nr:DUF4132 domain-containing protein [Hamadaea sp.]NUR74564.1 DUF4132 domain-containing protein [Hamadaea sp.]NUT21630.1 DUF4132 domain-containing protein [Hamadaea sp.]